MLEEVGADLEAPELNRELERAREEAVEKPAEQKELVVDNEHNNEADFERLTEMPDEWASEEDYFSTTRVSANRIDEESEWKHDAVSNMEDRPESLQEHLLEQFRFFNSSPEVREFGEFLIQNLDSNGRLPSPLPELCQVYGKAISPDAAREALAFVQKLDPLGVGAIDLKECLLLQVTDETPHRDVLITLISSHLEDLGQNRLPLIERKTGYSIELIKEALEELRHLNPTPGRGFQQPSAPNVTPDLTVEQDEHGKWIVKLEDEFTPISESASGIANCSSTAMTRRPRNTSSGRSNRPAG
ncbi:MAG: hypothetical protein U0903_14695 [Planctomycetales bacterium]